MMQTSVSKLALGVAVVTIVGIAGFALWDQKEEILINDEQPENVSDVSPPADKKGGQPAGSTDSAPPPVPQTAGIVWKTYKQEGFGEFIYPENWIVRESTYRTPAEQASGKEGSVVEVTVEPPNKQSADDTIIVGGRQFSCTYFESENCYDEYNFLRTKSNNHEILRTFSFILEDFRKKNDTVPVLIYFSNPRIKQALTCIEVVPAIREIPRTPSIATAAVNELLKGPTEEERSKGFLTEIPLGSELNSLSIVNGVARADFNKFTESGGGSCSMAMRTAQIRETLLRFSTVNSVTLSIDGRTKDIFQP